MQYFPMHYLMTVQHLPQIDRKVAAYGVLWTLAIGAAVAWIVA